MSDNLDLFEEEIEEIRDSSEIELDLFRDVLTCARGVVSSMGNSVSPVLVVDLIERSVEHLMFDVTDENTPITVDEAVSRAAYNLGLSEINEMFSEDKTPGYETQGSTFMQ